MVLAFENSCCIWPLRLSALAFCELQRGVGRGRDHQRDASYSCLGRQPCGLALSGSQRSVQGPEREWIIVEVFIQHLPSSWKQQLGGGHRRWGSGSWPGFLSLQFYPLSAWSRWLMCLRPWGSYLWNGVPGILVVRVWLQQTPDCLLQYFL